jgi:hypothetical protein
MNPFVSPAERAAHARALEALAAAGVPCLVGGAYAMFHYTGVVRYTKDLDLFLRPEDDARAREVLAAAGWATRVHEPQWLSKALWGETLVDLIHGSGNGLSAVDAGWLERGVRARVLGVEVKLVSPEETLWSKAFVQERDRWDGADVAHLVRALGPRLDWERLVARFGDAHWHVLFAHLLLFSFAYPDDLGAIPRPVWRRLAARARRLRPAPPTTDKVCRGTLLSRTQYLPDLGLWGYRDARELEVPGFAPPVADVCAPTFARHAEGEASDARPEPSGAACEA